MALKQMPHSGVYNQKFTNPVRAFHSKFSVSIKL